MGLLQALTGPWHAVCGGHGMAPHRLLVPALLLLGAALVLHLLLVPGETLDARAIQQVGRARPARPEPVRCEAEPHLTGRRARVSRAPGRSAARSSNTRSVADRPSAGARARREIRGRVLDAHGRPVADVRVRLCPDGGGPVRTQPTDGDGRYRHVTTGVGRWRARAEVNAVGTADAGPLDVGAGGTFEMPDLVLRGSGFVAGRVTFPDGAPADFVSVRALSDVPPPAFRSSACTPGLARSEALTDADGRFRITGLRSGALTVDAAGCTAVAAARGAEDVRLVVRLHRTRIRVLDARGRPHPLADIGIRTVREGRCPMGRAPVRRADGARNFWWDPGTRVIVAGHLDGHTVAEQELVVPETPWSRTIDLVLEPLGPDTGSLCLHLADDLGRSLPRPVLVLTSPLAGSRITRGGNHHPDAEGLVRDLPPGTFTAHVYPGDAESCPAADYCFPVERSITILPRVETRLDLRTRLGGRIQVRERCAPSVARDDLEAYVRFERAGAASSRPLWLDPTGDDVSPLLEPGPWTMVVYGEDVRDERRAVHVEAGRTQVEVVTLRKR